MNVWKSGADFLDPLSGSVRARIVALGLIAAIPAAGMAGIIAGQDYQGRERVAFDHVQRIQSLAVAQIDVTVTAIDASMGAAGHRLAANTLDCAAEVVSGLARIPRAATAMALFDMNGLLLCYDGKASLIRTLPVHDLDWFVEARSGFSPVLADFGPQHVAIVATAVDGGVMVAVLTPNWFDANGLLTADGDSALWVFNDHGYLVGSVGLAAEGLPSVSTLLDLQTYEGARLARSAGNVPYAYTSSRMANGWQVIGAYQSVREHRKAEQVLYTRIADLAALLLLGLAITVLGADIAFGGPLRRLRIALAEWQAGALFDPTKITFAPTELVDLAESFTAATISLQAQKAELEQAKTRQELLMLEIHHRVKNNLQIVASLLNLQASRIRVPEARAEFQSARDRVRALATLHRHLYSEGEIHTVNMPNFLSELSAQLLQAMGEEQDGRIKLIIDAEEIRLSTDQAVPLALIVTEAVTNATKYGFPDGRTGVVSIHLAQHDGTLDLTIADDGVGIPSGRKDTESGTRDGIGLQLIRGFSRQLGATLEVTEHPGTRYSIHMPLRVRTPDGDDPGPHRQS